MSGSSIETSPFTFSTELYLALLEIDSVYGMPTEQFNIDRAMSPLYSIQNVIDTYIGPAAKLAETSPYMEIMVKVAEKRATQDEFDSLIPFAKTLRKQLLNSESTNHQLILDIMDMHRNISILGMKFFQMGFLPDRVISQVDDILEELKSFSVIGVSGYNEGDTDFVETLSKRVALLMRIMESGDQERGLTTIMEIHGTIAEEQSNLIKELGYSSVIDSLIAEALYATPEEALDSVANYL